MNQPRIPEAVATLTLRLFDALAASMLAAIACVVLWGVFTRFLVGAPAPWTEEAARLLMVWLTMFGAAAAAGRAEHLGVGFVADRLHPDARLPLRAAIEAVVLVFSTTVMVGGGAILVIESLVAQQLTPALNVPMGWVYSATPVSGLGIAFFSLDRLLNLMSTRPDLTAEE